jgi:hypothetical protein
MLVSFNLEIVLILTQDRCTVCAKRTIGSEIILDTLVGILGDVAQVEARISLFRESDNLDASWVHALRRTYHRLRNRSRRT